jgi:CubicO group peptidase (beta-lactamase class C family)
MPKFRTAIAIAGVVLLQACWFDADLKHDLGTRPARLDDGWEIDTPEHVGLSTRALSAIHRELLREDRQYGTLGLMVVKDGKLVWETYLRSMADRDHYHHLQSVTKSVTSLAVGLAWDDGSIPALDMTTGELFPDEVKGLDPRTAKIKLTDLFTMRSGLTFDNDDFSVEMWVDKPSHPLRYMLAKPLYADPGRRFYYRDVDPQIVGYALQKLTGRREGDLVKQRVFKPLGIHDYYWEQGPDGVYLAAHGLHLRPRDLAKIGQLLLDRGQWQGERVVSEDWLDQATVEQAKSDTRDAKGKLFPYGYYFWIIPDVGFAAWGHGGQFILVVPKQQMVIVQVSLPDTDDLQGSHLNDLLALVAPLLDAA